VTAPDDRALALRLESLAAAQEGVAFPHELAALAIRRWRSFDRRDKARRPTLDLRVRDLAKGLAQNYPGDLLFVPPGVLERLAGRFGEILSRDE
jgi:hypothetical protein